MFVCKKRFWLENLPDLFCSLSLIPTQTMSPENQFNALTRLILAVSIMLYILNYKYTSIFLLFSIVLIVAIYYVQQKCKQESYTPMITYQNQPVTQTTPIGLNELRNYQNTLLRTDQDVTRSGRSFQTQYEMEVREAGPPLPRTLVKPIVVDPPYMNMPDGYNEPTCNSVIQRKIQFKNLTEDSVEGFSQERNTMRPYEKIVTESNPPSHSFSGLDNRNPYYRDSSEIRGNDKMYVDEIPTSCGYNPHKLSYGGVPVNYPAAPMSLNDKMKDYNEKIFTNRYGSVLYRNEVQEPNFIQNLQSDHYSHGPVTKEFQPKNGSSIVVRRDPNSFKMPPTELDNPFEERPSLSNVFDGRSIGYGQEYRAYIDPVASTVNYMYDDVDTGIRGYNYLSRNKIDIYPEAEQTGIMNDHGPNPNIHKITHQGFIDRTNQFRNDMVEGYIREFDAVEAQRKMYPTQSYYGRRR
jgi:hypothetical protein